MDVNRSLRAFAAVMLSAALPCLCCATLILPQSAMAQAGRKAPAAVANQAVPIEIAQPEAYVRRSPLKKVSGPVPAHVQSVGGAMLTIDQAAVHALRHVDAVQLTDFVLAPDLSVVVDLHRTEIFADDAVLLGSRMTAKGVESEALAKPDMTILVGRTVDDPDSVVALSFSEWGVQGFASRFGETFVITSGAVTEQNQPIAYRLDADAAEALNLGDFACGTDDIPQPNAPDMTGSATAAGFGNGNPPCRIARIAIETDYEFTQTLFGGNTGASMAYAATLLAGSSEVFKRDVNVRFQIVFLQLWTNPADPWGGGNTSQQLGEFADYWQANNEWIERDIAHFLSGRQLGGGIAWLSALCADGIDYSLSANLRGTFPYPTLMTSDFNWDIIVVTHELGHNFGSPHTHSYNPPIDGCGTGNCAGAENGTLMSYCHQCPGGLSNMNIRFHEVVIDRILDYLDNDVICDLFDTDSFPDPNNDFFYVAANAPNRIDVLRNDLSGNCSPPTIIAFASPTANGANIALSPGTGPEGRDELIYTPANGFLGADQFLYTVTNGSGTNVQGLCKLQVIPLREAVVDTGCSTPGLAVAYYELNSPGTMPNFNLIAPYAGEIVAQIDYESTEGNFAGSGRSDQVGAVYTGAIEIPQTGAYVISAISDDGSFVFLNGDLVVNNDGLHGMIEVESLLGLEAGIHELRVEFFENGGGAGLQLLISGPGVAKQAVPASMLKRAGAQVGDLVATDTFLPPGDGVVNGADLAFLLGEWGVNASSPADIVHGAIFLPPGDGNVNGADLGYLLGSWGDCLP